MIRLDFDAKDQQRTPAGRYPKLEPISVQQARANAQALLSRQGSTSHLLNVVDLLFTGGVLSARQLHITTRTLRRYVAQRVVDRLPYTSNAVVESLSTLGVSVSKGEQNLLYTLGPVGAEIVRLRYDVVSDTRYLAYPEARIFHDLLISEVVLRIGHLARQHDWETNWQRKQAASLRKENGKLVLEPDALLQLVHKKERHTFLLKYHDEENEWAGFQTSREYEMARLSKLWQQAWDVDEFPPVLAVFQDQVVAEGYKRKVQEWGDKGCTFYGRTLEGFLKGPETWFDFQKNQRTGNLFPWSEKGESHGDDD